MATVADPESAFGRRQARMFRWMRDVPIDRYSLTARWDALGDMARPRDEARYPGTEAVAIPLTEERYRIAGFDGSDAVEGHFLTFVRRGGEWAVASDTDLDDLGLPSARHMWHFGPVEVERAGNHLFVTHECRGTRPCSRAPAALTGLTDEAVERASRYWPRWERRVVMMIPATAEWLKRMLQVTFDLDNFVAFAYATVDSSEDVRFTAPRVMFNEVSLRDRSRDSALRILAHELLHVATRAASGPFVPVFVEEGFAELAGHGIEIGSPSVVVTGLPVRLPADHEFVTGTAAEILGSYQVSLAAVRFFAERWGLAELRRFYRELGSRRVAAGTARYHLSDALRSTVGTSLRGFERAWASSIRQ